MIKGWNKGVVSYMNLLVLCHSYTNFQKDPVECLSIYFDKINVLVRYNPLANLSKYIPINSLASFNLDNKLDLSDMPENISVYPTPVFYGPLDSQYKKIGEKHFRSVEKLIKDKNIKFDLVLSHFTWSAGYVGAKLKHKYDVPCIVLAHGYDIYDLPFKDDEWKSKIKGVLNAVDYIMTVSDKNLACIKALNVNTPVSCVTNGFKANNFKLLDKNSARQTVDIPLEKKVILAIGNLVKIKGHRYLIESMQKVVNNRKDVVCYIIGEGKLRGKLQKMINNLELDEYVKLVGRKPHNEIPLWLNASDLFVMPSLGEGNPTVMFEALGCGAPFLGTCVGGIPEVIISNDYGLLCAPADKDELAQKILLALDKKWDSHRIISYAQQFTWEKISDQIYDIFEHVLSDKLIGC